MGVGNKTFHCGEIARAAGVSADTIRHYERIGILPPSPRTASGYRVYSAESIQRVQLVRRALQVGFTLTELAEIFRVRDQGGVPCHRVLEMTEEKLHSLEKQIQDLRRTQGYMRKLIREWRAQLKRTPRGQKAMLLHSLAECAIPAKILGLNLKKRNAHISPGVAAETAKTNQDTIARRK